ncbi:glycosyltransferase family 4 protein [Bradyrhizobium hipponense]|uniref:Glycosyltransferase family 4 protein n=1 Tax=Bradyrhizobium hipponense TaxID=2605638 RepID=A0A5S4YC68_9BRAD|nr:glycosyltransferase family 4 protein [Bradyrhizobium hipponense]TYO61097.1 glycosyltransferase family 4 protein [Bradyrhizobium hipponense]
MSVSTGVLMPLPLTGKGVGYTCGSLANGMVDQDFGVTIVTPRSRWPLPSVEVIEALPIWKRYLPYGWVKRGASRSMEAAFLKCMDRSRSRRLAAYLWPNASMELLQELKRRDITIFREQFNCHTKTAKTILDRAYAKIGAAPKHGITDATVRGETEILEAMDYIFCPNQSVEASLIENGVPKSKCLATAYGWDPARLSGKRKLLPPNHGITAVFVGIICVRKGAHLILDYWARSRVKGRLVLAGRMEPVIKEKCASLLARDDVTVLEYIEDVGSLYRSSDVFVFPTLEEGGPQVTYEACGCGLPAITTNMGAGRIVRDQREGFVLDPYDASGWITALRALSEDIELRQRMSVAAVEHANRFTWTVVASQRREQMIGHLGHGN